MFFNAALVGKGDCKTRSSVTMFCVQLSPKPDVILLTLPQDCGALTLNINVVTVFTDPESLSTSKIEAMIVFWFIFDSTSANDRLNVKPILPLLRSRVLIGASFTVKEALGSLSHSRGTARPKEMRPASTSCQTSPHRNDVGTVS